MPTAPLRVCAYPGCASRVPSGYCARHAPHPAKGWGSSGATRIRGTRLQRLRAQLFDHEPLCRPCAQPVEEMTRADYRSSLKAGALK